MELLQANFTPWIISNIIVVILLIVAIKKPKLARLLFALVFFWACWLNYTTSQQNPQDYLDYASFTPFSFYESFINGWFKTNITAMVTAISIGQGLIAIGLLLKGWMVRIACYGAIVFFLAIAPLGVGAAFPFSITACIAIYFIIKNDDLNLVWKFRSK